MTPIEITVLLDKPDSATPDDIRQLAGEDFPALQEAISARYSPELIEQYVHALEDARRVLDEIVQRGAELYSQAFAAASASYYSTIASMPPDMYLFANTALVRDYAASVCEEAMDAIDRFLTPTLAIQAVRPTSYVMQVDNVFRHLPQLQAENSVYVGRRGKQEVHTMVSLALPEQYELEGKTALDAYDKAVLNGVNSLLENGTVNFTVPMLYHAMTGKANPTVDEKLLTELRRRIDVMRRTLITIDLQQELSARYVELNITEPTVQGYLLPLTVLSARVNGKPVQVYHLLDTPPMLAYARMKRQLATVPLSLLNAPLNNNATTIPLKNYLFARCEAMRNQNNSIKSNKILFASIYEELGESEAGKVRKKRIRDYTEVILKHMADRKYIKGYTLTRSGRTIDGVEIRL